MTADFVVMSRMLSSMPIRVSLEGVTGVILAAGLGQRMGKVGLYVPKPLLPALNCPIVGWNIALMRQYNIRDVVLNTHHLAAAFDTLPTAAGSAGTTITLLREAELSGPFGGVLACSAAARKTDNLVVLAGDGIYETDFKNMIETHRLHGAELTIGTASVSHGSRYGVLEIDEYGIVKAMREKPPGVGYVSTASCGVYIVSPNLIAKMNTARRPLDWVDVVHSLLDEGFIVASHPVDRWMDAGTPEDLLKLNMEMLSDKYLHLVAREAGATCNASVWLQGESNVSDAKLDGTVLIGDGATLESDAVVQDSIIGSQARIGKRAEIRNSVVLPGAVVPEDSTVFDAIVM
ncbi:MAG: NDP-sugar synthase [Micropepsaceae bacterium]